MLAYLRILTISIFVCISYYGVSQVPGDTIFVNAMNYSSLTRDTIAQFPDLPGVTYEKILLNYNVRCYNGSVNTMGGNNNGPGSTNGCGEWDYSSTMWVIDSTLTDSVNFTHPSHIVSGLTGTTYDHSTQPIYDFYQFTNQQVVLNSITSETQSPILSGSIPAADALAGTNKSGKSQFLYTASELLAAGVTPGTIDGFLVNALNGGTVNFLKIRVKGTSLTALDPGVPDTSGFFETFNDHYTFVTGANRIQFHSPYVWNGTDNIVLEFSFTNSGGGVDIQLESTPSTNLGMKANNGYNLNLSAAGSLDVPADSMYGLYDEITVSFWLYGDPNQMPTVTTIVEGLDSFNIRQLNTHLPWIDANMYFDCGADFSSADRINKLANPSEMGGQWNHFALVKNATTGIMRIYLNGTLWHSGTGKTRPILNPIKQLTIGKGGYSGSFPGAVDEFRFWDKALTEIEIQDWMNNTITPAHPSYANLIAYYPMDEGNGSNTADVSVNGMSATIDGGINWRYERGEQLTRSFSETAYRPSITLFQGVYDLTITPVAVLDSVPTLARTIKEYAVSSNIGSSITDDIVMVSEWNGWDYVATQNIYDGQTGVLLGTIPVTAPMSTLNITQLDYVHREPGRFELVNYITPYGIGLDLGPNGKTWTYDVTDYTPVLKGDKRLFLTGAGVWQEQLDLTFLFIVGTPPRDVMKIQNIWTANGYGASEIFSDAQYEPRTIDLDPNAGSFRVKNTISGHGQEGEFISRLHYVDVNGGPHEFVWPAYKECAENPIYPQGGTWLYDRAGWCPGTAADVNNFEITPYVSPGQTITLDYGLENSFAPGASWYASVSRLVTYGHANHNLDAAVLEVRQPSNRLEFERFNSICNEPSITIQNTGSQALTSVTITYWINDPANVQTYEWNGNLNFMETEIVTLPAPRSMWNSLDPSGGNKFYARVSNPNGGVDEYEHNNTYISPFEIPEVMPQNIIVWFKTNNVASESSYELIDEYTGTVILSRSGMAANTLYKDTVQLASGHCFVYKVYDTGDDGLAWWANNDGSGYTRFQEVGGTIVKAFEPDFGDNINYHFTSDFPLSYDEINGLKDISIYPNPANSVINIEFEGLSESVQLTVFNVLGEHVIESQIKTYNGKYQGELKIGDLKPGIYLLSITDGIVKRQVKFIKE